MGSEAERTSIQLSFTESEIEMSGIAALEGSSEDKDGRFESMRRLQATINDRILTRLKM
jgi:hypothetical protein